MRAEKGPDGNQLNLRFKNETNEGIILQLNSQVGQCSAVTTIPCCKLCCQHPLAYPYTLLDSLYMIIMFLGCTHCQMGRTKHGFMSIICYESSILPAAVQVEFMTSQMSEMQREVDNKLKTEGALKTAEQARKEVCACHKPNAALHLYTAEGCQQHLSVSICRTALLVYLIVHSSNIRSASRL